VLSPHRHKKTSKYSPPVLNSPAKYTSADVFLPEFYKIGNIFRVLSLDRERLLALIARGRGMGMRSFLVPLVGTPNSTTHIVAGIGRLAEEDE